MSIDEINNEGTNSRIASITNEQQQDYARARLTHIRQLARSTASRASDADVRRYALYGELYIKMQGILPMCKSYLIIHIIIVLCH